MRLFLLMEMIVAVAVGLGLARIGMADRMGLRAYPLALETANEVFAGVGIVLGLVTWLEVARKGPRVAPGPGRRAWATILAYLVLTNAFLMARLIRFESRRRGFGPLVSRLVEVLREYHASGFLAPVATVILALGLTHRLGRAEAWPEPDAREWALRVALAVAVSTYLGIEVLGMFTL